jgi:LPXTG-motif cell wall-anchored protein
VREKFNSRQRLAAGLVAIAMGGIAMAAATVPAWAGPSAPAQVPGEPIFFPGNPTCSTLVPGTTELKVEPVTNGPHSDGTLSVTITVVNNEATGPTFNWTSNIGVDAVFVKGGPGGNLYLYAPEATSGNGLHAPTNPANGKFFGLSHVSFCYDADMPTTTSSTTTTMPTTTAPPTTAPPTTAPTTTAPPPGRGVAAPARAELPVTGDHSLPLAIAGGALLAIGLVLVARSRQLSHR